MKILSEDFYKYVGKGIVKNILEGPSELEHTNLKKIGKDFPSYKIRFFKDILGRAFRTKNMDFFTFFRKDFQSYKREHLKQNFGRALRTLNVDSQTWVFQNILGIIFLSK